MSPRIFGSIQSDADMPASIYVGNLAPYCTQNDIIPYFQGYGFIVEIRLQADRGFAFIKLDSHENAANAICNLQGVQVQGRPLKCSWGKDRAPGEAAGTAPVTSPVASPPAQTVGSTYKSDWIAMCLTANPGCVRRAVQRLWLSSTRLPSRCRWVNTAMGSGIARL